LGIVSFRFEFRFYKTSQPFWWSKNKIVTNSQDEFTDKENAGYFISNIEQIARNLSSASGVSNVNLDLRDSYIFNGTGYILSPKELFYAIVSG
jgi:hypothetical protein